LTNELLPHGTREETLYSQALQQGIDIGCETMKTNVLLEIEACMIKDPNLHFFGKQLLVSIIEGLK
jgi:hypothetical protein